MTERVQTEWQKDEPLALTSLHDFLRKHPEAEDPEFAVYVAHVSMAAQMLEKNPSPAMFREFHVAWRSLRVALESTGKNQTLGDLIGGSDDYGQ